MPGTATFGRRRAGVLLHPTSLPGPGPAGTLGDARRLFDFLHHTGCSVWQVLPLLPVNDSLSPYQPLSLFAGNTALIDPVMLAETLDTPAPDPADGAAAVASLIDHGAERLRRGTVPALDAALAAFRRHQASWLDAWCVFAALRERLGGIAWPHWPPKYRVSGHTHLPSLRGTDAAAAEREALRQFVFHSQWQRLKTEANARGICLYGDLPFYPAADSADVWSHPHLFRLDSAGHPAERAGVPPDAFSASGQDWGAPAYDWTAMQRDGYRWWLDRIRHQVELFDILRIDHFRGLQACWSIPAGREPTEGSWQAVPGARLLRSLCATVGEVALVAEDLGYITPGVDALRRRFGLPGMLVLQFGFDGEPDNPHHPERHDIHCVVYTGTHDNATVEGWWQALDEAERARVRQATGDTPEPVHRRLVGLAMASPAEIAVAPMQDLLGLGNDARMNVPGTTEGNWCWRMTDSRAFDQPVPWLRPMVADTARAHRA